MKMETFLRLPPPPPPPLSPVIPGIVVDDDDDVTNDERRVDDVFIATFFESLSSQILLFLFEKELHDDQKTHKTAKKV